MRGVFLVPAYLHIVDEGRHYDVLVSVAEQIVDDGSGVHTRADFSHPFQPDVSVTKAALRKCLIIFGTPAEKAPNFKCLVGSIQAILPLHGYMMA